MDLTKLFRDMDLGSTEVFLQRTHWYIRNGQIVPERCWYQFPACVFRKSERMLGMMPEEYRNEPYIGIYSGYSITAGDPMNDTHWVGPDLILWDHQSWRVVWVQDWQKQKVFKALAVLVPQNE